MSSTFEKLSALAWAIDKILVKTQFLLFGVLLISMTRQPEQLYSFHDFNIIDYLDQCMDNLLAHIQNE